MNCGASCWSIDRTAASTPPTIPSTGFARNAAPRSNASTASKSSVAIRPGRQVADHAALVDVAAGTVEPQVAHLLDQSGSTLRSLERGVDVTAELCVAVVICSPPAALLPLHRVDGA